ncbi:hypothetical protein VK70_19220 [Paenibacillus durus ATCC 35681]|uniref:Uncharacterized protein n=1 Tax=Paenibacillus durus ATCC 35681 TaxID=1333534 RepID=A0A0F7FDC8_PAEDU|nr:hypothetical protein VK70_19220 [Paenibacillus durus ATCC 35681]
MDDKEFCAALLYQYNLSNILHCADKINLIYNKTVKCKNLACQHQIFQLVVLFTPLCKLNGKEYHQTTGISFLKLADLGGMQCTEF